MTPMEILPIQQGIQDQNGFYKCSHYFVYESLRSLLISISFFRTTVFQINCSKLLVIVLIKRCIKSFEFFFSQNLIRSFGMFIIISLINIIFLIICHPTLINFRFLRLLHDSMFIIFSIFITAFGENSPHFSNKSICKKIFIFLISISIPPIKHLINEQRYTFSLVLKPF